MRVWGWGVTRRHRLSACVWMHVHVWVRVCVWVFHRLTDIPTSHQSTSEDVVQYTWGRKFPPFRWSNASQRVGPEKDNFIRQLFLLFLSSKFLLCVSWILKSPTRTIGWIGWICICFERFLYPIFWAYFFPRCNPLKLFFEYGFWRNTYFATRPIRSLISMYMCFASPSHRWRG